MHVTIKNQKIRTCQKESRRFSGKMSEQQKIKKEEKEADMRITGILKHT